MPGYRREGKQQFAPSRHDDARRPRSPAFGVAGITAIPRSAARPHWRPTRGRHDKLLSSVDLQDTTELVKQQ